MSLEVLEKAEGKIFEVHLSGKLDHGDYQQFVPEIERLIQEHGKIRVLVEMHDFHGWKMRALWDDVKFDFKHFNDIERIAFVGETGWQHGMAAMCKPFTSATIKYFDQSEKDKARAWLEEKD